jgi:ketosteroid isomerase-like protein
VRSISLALLAIALATTACQPPAQEAGPLSEEDVAAVRAADDLWVQAFRDNDDATLVALYSDEAVIMPPNEPAVEGRAAIQAYHEADLVTVMEYSESIVEIDGRDGLAYIRGTSSMVGRAKDGEPVIESDKFLVIFRKQADGSWLITHEIWNSDLPLPEQSAEPQFVRGEYWSCPKDQIPALEQAVDSIWGPLFNELVAEGRFISWGAAAPVKAFKVSLQGEQLTRAETEPDWGYVFSWYAESEQAFDAAWAEFESRLRAKFPDDPRPFRFCPDLVIVHYDVRTPH